MTFSITARCPMTGAFGIAISSSSICVPSRCAWVGPLGAVATQNFTNPALGPAGLALLRQGLGARGVLESLIAGDPSPAWRQVAVVDRYGQVAWHSGTQAFPTVGVATGAGCVAMGNILANDAVPNAMVQAFAAAAEAPLAERLLLGLEAGLAAGGEITPVRSAGLHVAQVHDWPVVDLRIDWADQPIAALRDLWNLYSPQQASFLHRAIDPDHAPV
jgi:uncharacterized Ntn-hydrolase superfamily protein